MPSCCGTDAEPISFRVPDTSPEQLSDRPPETEPVASLCPRCLSLEWPTADDAVEPDEDLDFSRVSDAFPRGDAAIPFALALGLCSSLATHRESVAALLREVERAGSDPLLAMDRLIGDPEIEPTIDLERRRHQVEQLLY